jgi:hypothetical protein
MDKTEFESVVINGDRTDYVSDEVLEYMATELDFRTIDRSAMKKEDIDQSACISVSLPQDTSDMLGKELEKRVKESLVDGSRDIQFYQVRHNGKAPTVIEVWRHGSGYSAFALTS